ncbi:MAG TPA: tetratricopeptide repeat protein [Polyangia bacterium]|jgi:tetratricopeptide (TPR) repeat protein|nr:tetratricopeptide repeat protein [Polyangia bacterium]
MGQRALPPLVILLGLSLGVGGIGRSASAAELTPLQKQEMKQLYERATRAYDVGKYNEAIEEYQKAYEIGGDPPMLYNIAQAYRLNDQPTEALRFYRRYLQRAPSARNREDVERKIAELEKSVEDKRKAAAAVTPPPAPVTPPAPVVTAPPPAPVPVPAPAPADATVGGGVPATIASPPAAPVEEQSSTRAIISWSVLGAGVVTAGVGAVFGILAKQKSNSVTNMSSSNPPVEFNPQLEHDGKVYNNLFIGLTIAGGAVAATGVVLLLTGGSSAEAPAAAPPATAQATFIPWLGAGLVGAGADFRF